MGFNEFRVKIMIFRKFILFSLKQRLFFARALPTWVHGRGLSPLQNPALLPAACGAEELNDDPEKKLLFFMYSSFGNKPKLSIDCNFLT